MIVLHYLNDSRAFRILWLLEELGLPYEIKYYQRDSSGFAPAELAAIHPSGRSPIIDDDGVIVAESGLIIQYIMDKYGKGSELAVVSEKDKLQVDYWLFAVETMMIGYVFTYVNAAAKPHVPFGIRFLIGQYTKRVEKAYPLVLMKTYLKLLDQSIRDNGGFIVAGHLTGADIICEHTVSGIRKGPCKDLDDEFPHLADWLKMIARRPGFQRATAVDANLSRAIPDAKI